jgi:drug/metabolite transporter (DMT)-like permease
VTSGPIRTKIFWAFAAIYVVWGSTYLAIQIAIETMPPFLLAGGRFLVAGSILFAWALWKGEAIPAFPVWRSAALMGSLFFVLGNGLVVWAEQHVPSGRTALLASTSPIWTVLIESALDKWRPPKARVVVGIGLGIIGLALLTTRSAGPAPISLLGLLGLVVASMAWAGGAVLSHRRHLPASPAMATGLKMLGGGAQLAVLALVLGEGRRFSMAQVSTASWLAAGYLVVFGSIIGFTAFTYLLRETTPEMVGTSSYVNPLVAVFLGWALASEPVTGRMLLGAAVSLSGVVLIRWPTAAPQLADEPEVGAVETGEYPVVRREG